MARALSSAHLTIEHGARAGDGPGASYLTRKSCLLYTSDAADE